MGTTLRRLLSSTRGFGLVALVERPGHPAVGEEVSIGREATKEQSLRISSTFPDDVDPDTVVIDFSHAEAMSGILEAVRRRNLKLVSGTTGLEDNIMRRLKRYAARRPVFHDSNMSLGIAVLKDIAAQAVRELGDGFDIEIVEYHHRGKRDHPSGTALSLGAAVPGARRMIRGRGRGVRKAGDIHVHSIRAGGIQGRHDIVFASDEEMLILSHTALARDVFARGALRAAAFIAGKRNGFYGMHDLLKTL
jgi:4-hydroxy-tetrahydrodipicolinate reductase